MRRIYQMNIMVSKEYLLITIHTVTPSITFLVLSRNMCILGITFDIQFVTTDTNLVRKKSLWQHEMLKQEQYVQLVCCVTWKSPYNQYQKNVFVINRQCDCTEKMSSLFI